MKSWRWLAVAALSVAAVLAFSACGDDDEEDGGTATPAGTATAAPDGGGEALKIGVLMSFTGALSDFGEPIYNGAELAADEINAAGGVNGKPIELVRGDDGTNPDTGVTEATRMVEVEGVSAIVGALSSGVSLQVAETVTGPAGVVQISPASTSPGLSDANDDDFLFRTTISDAAQGLLLGRLAEEESLTDICAMYINNAYGQGLSEAFDENSEGVTATVPHEDGAASYTSELQQCGSATTLAALSYPETAGIYLREAVEGGKFQNYLFSDGSKSDAMLEDLGWDAFDGMRGTSPSSLPTEGVSTFNDRYEAAYGVLPPRPYIKEAYDAVYVIALAAEAAGSNDGTAIRDNLRDVANDDGGDTQADPGEEGFAAAVEALAGGDNINYEGVVGPIEWDDNGDPTVGAIEYFTVDAANRDLVTTNVFRVDLEAGVVTEITELVLGTPAP
jgi:ABC-type branched-subunit amino acid transport system substrate-binding protein